MSCERPLICRRTFDDMFVKECTLFSCSRCMKNRIESVMGKTILIIPARGGSKRIPRKNIRPFCGKATIAWSILAGLESKLFDHIFVSTDDEEIADTAIQWGAEARFRRPRELADNHTRTL